MLKILKFISIVIGISIALLVGYSFVDRQFKLSNVKGKWPVVSSHPIEEKQKGLLKEIFNQPFFYLDRGKQSFVFVSHDDQYVLKFFDARCLRSGAQSFLFSIEEEDCAKRLEQLFEGYRVAALDDPANTGLVFLQLAPDPSYTFDVIVADRFSIKHEINLAEVPFVIQKKATPLRELISELLDEGDVEETKRRLHQIMEMYIAGYKKGLVDLDYNFMYNTGFIGDNPIRIDLGRLQINDTIKDPSVYRQNLHKIFIIRLGGWLERHFPKYREEILQDMKNQLQSI